MKFFPKYHQNPPPRPLLRWLSCVMAVTFLCAIASAQYYYPPPGYYPGYYPQYPPQQPQQPRRQRPARPRYQEPTQHPQSQPQSPRSPEDNPSHNPDQPTQKSPDKKPRTAKDISAAAPPAADFAAIAAGLLTTYTWDDRDSLSDLARASGISNSQLLALNGLAVSQLRSGQVLRVPPLAATTPTLDIVRDAKAQRAREVWRGVRGKKHIALTFDAGGVADSLDLLLQNLTSANASATFFSTGEFVKKNPKAIQAIKNAGFKIYNHSWSHPEFTKESDDEIRGQLQRADDAISSATGQSTKPYFRPPFGDRDNRVLRIAADAGYRSIYWTHDSLDSVGDKKTADFIANRVLNPPSAKSNPDNLLDGAIILMHVGEEGTAAAIPEIVKGLRTRGFTLVTIEEILRP